MTSLAKVSRPPSSATGSTDGSRARDVMWILLGCAFVVAARFVATRGRDSFRDFHLHYFAGLIERSGSYTDNLRVFRAMTDAGLPIPRDGVYGTPTLVGLVFQPLSHLSLIHAQYIWVALCALLLTLGVRKAVANRYWPAWLLIVTCAPATLLGLQIGNTSVPINAALLYAYGCFRAGQSRRVGIVLGAVTALKLYPGFLVLVLVAKRDWDALKAALLSLAALVVLTLLVLGPADAWTGLVATFKLGGYVQHSFDNVSWPGAIRLMSNGPELAHWLSYATLAAGAAIVWSNRRRETSELYALAIVTMLLVQSISWRHYAPMMTVAVLSLVAERRTTLSMVNVAFAYLLATGWVGVVITHSFEATRIVNASYTLGATCLLALMLSPKPKASLATNSHSESDAIELRLADLGRH